MKTNIALTTDQNECSALKRNACTGGKIMLTNSRLHVFDTLQYYAICSYLTIIGNEKHDTTYHLLYATYIKQDSI